MQPQHPRVVDQRRRFQVARRQGIGLEPLRERCERDPVRFLPPAVFDLGESGAERALSRLPGPTATRRIPRIEGFHHLSVGGVAELDPPDDSAFSVVSDDGASSCHVSSFSS